jgi:hypothetical protein
LVASRPCLGDQHDADHREDRDHDLFAVSRDPVVQHPNCGLGSHRRDQVTERNYLDETHGSEYEYDGSSELRADRAS